MPDYQDKLAQEGLKLVTLCIPAVELLQQLVPTDVWNIYAPDMNPVPWTHAAAAWEKKDHQAYMKKRSAHSAALGRGRDWTKVNIYLASRLWKIKTRSQVVKTRINRILYDQTWHGDNKAKGKRLSPEEIARLGICELCEGMDSQLHILNGCRHPTMMKVREWGRHQIIHRLQGATQCQRSRCMGWVLTKEWSEHNPPAETWLGYWSDEAAERVHDKLRGEKYTGNASRILKNLTYYYEPICSTVYALYAVRSALLRHMSVQGALSGIVVSPFFDGFVIKAASSKWPIYRSIVITGNHGGRLNTARTRQPSHRDNPVNCQGLLTHTPRWIQTGRTK